MQQQQNEAEGSWKAAIRTLTRNYRHEALGLCQEPSSHLGWEISQHLLDQCWADAIPTAKAAASVIHVCPGCGAILYPGSKSACLRVARFPPELKFERTRRRRNLRRQKRLRLALQKQSKPLNRSNTSDETPPMVEHVLLRDDQGILFDRHHLTLKCQRCDCIIRLKGVKREVAPTKQDIQRKQVVTSGFVKTSKKTILKEESSDGGDFLVLPPAAAASKAAASLVPPKMARTFVQNTKKEKKKKLGHQEKKSKLMSFLSSLND